MSERQWGTVREDYSADGEAWAYLPHDRARSQAYRWGEDGLAGFCDVEQRLCLSLALWNGRDPILKERAFGLTGRGGQSRGGRQGILVVPGCPSEPCLESVALPLPAAGVSLRGSPRENGRRGKWDPEYELLDTGAFDEDRYWIVEVHYAKADPHDLLMSIQVTNAGPDADTVHVLPTAWFRNTWSWDFNAPKPALTAIGPHRRCRHRTSFARRARAARRSRTGRDRADAPLLRERDQPRPAVRDLDRARPIPRTGSTTTSCRARRRSTRR